MMVGMHEGQQGEDGVGRIDSEVGYRDMID